MSSGGTPCVKARWWRPCHQTLTARVRGAETTRCHQPVGQKPTSPASNKSRSTGSGRSVPRRAWLMKGAVCAHKPGSPGGQSSTIFRPSRTTMKFSKPSKCATVAMGASPQAIQALSRADPSSPPPAMALSAAAVA